MSIKSRKNLAGTLFFFVLICFLGFYIYSDINRGESSDRPVDKKQTEILDVVQNGEISATLDESSLGNFIGSGSKDETEVNLPKQPNLDKEVINLSNIEDTAFITIKKAIHDKVTEVRDNPNDESLWLTLSTLRKMVGDYKLSVEILNYISVRWPLDYIPLFNLADLYQFYIKDYKLAEQYLLRVIEMAPGHIGSYENLYLLYNSGYDGKQSKALQVLISGLEQNPKSTDLMVSIARHYSSIGDIDSSTTYYNKAVDLAKFLGNRDLEKLISLELSELRK